MSAARILLLPAVLAVLAAIRWPGAAVAQVTDSVYTVGEITITAARGAVSSARAPQRITVLDERDIAATAARSVADLVSARTGLFIRRQGQGLATVSQRGGHPSQTQLLIDGMRLADPQLGQFDLSLLPTHLFETIEILHGPGSALFGTDGMSGIVHLRRRHSDGDRLTVLTEAGAFGERLASAGYSFTNDGLSGLVSAEYRYSDGDFPFVDHTLFPPREVRRSNADRESQSVFATLEGAAGRHRLRGAFMYIDSRQGIPGLVGAAQTGERRWDRHARLWLEDALPVGTGVLSLRGFVHRGILRYVNPGLGVDDTGRTVTGGLESEYRTRVGSRAAVSIGGAGGFGSAGHPSLAAAASEVHAAAFTGASVDYDGFRLYPALRFDAYHQQDGTRSALSPRLGVNVRPDEDLPVFVKLSVGTGFSIPTFNQRFWQPGGDPDLSSERAVTLDAGVYAGFDPFGFEVTGFAARYENQIVWTDEGDGYWTARNLAETRTTGVEISAQLSPSDAFTTGAVYAFTLAVDRSDPFDPSYGRQLRYVPRHLANAYVSAVLGPFRIDLHGQVLGRRYVTSDETEHLDPTFAADAQLGIDRPLGPFRARLSVVIENALDTRYAVIQGYPMPPRHARLRLRLETR